MKNGWLEDCVTWIQGSLSLFPLLFEKRFIPLSSWTDLLGMCHIVSTWAKTRGWELMFKVIQHCMHVYSVIGNMYKTEEKTLLAMGAKNEEKISQRNYFFAVAFFFRFTSGKWVSSAQIHQNQVNCNVALLSFSAFLITGYMDARLILYRIRAVLRARKGLCDISRSRVCNGIFAIALSCKLHRWHKQPWNWKL